MVPVLPSYILVSRLQEIFDASPYQYVPTEGITILFIVLFGLSTGKSNMFLVSSLLLIYFEP